MATDPRRLKPSELCRLLNSTPRGEVISERQLYRHRSRAGLRIGDGKHVDLVRYVAWLVSQRHAPKPEPVEDPYVVVKERSRARNRAIALAGRDIGELPLVANPPRRLRAASDFRYFCDCYFPLTFSLPWSEDHLKVIARIEQAVLRGGLFAMAMPRGSGKSSISECACIWAVLNGHREFVCLIGSDEGHAMDMLDAIKMELDGNDLLQEDFPDAVYPIQCLDGIANRCNGQLYRGERTHIGWTAREVVLPTLRPAGWLENEELRPFVRDDGTSKASGADRGRFAVLGLTEPIILPADNESEFKRQVTFEGVVPAKNVHKGKFAVLLEPVADGKIGLAVVAGVVPVRLQVDPAKLYDCAEIIDGNTLALVNLPHGSARVLWVEATGSTERWAVVRLDDGDHQAHVLITSNVPDADGYYPGEVQRYDVDTKTWQTLFACKVLDINQ